MLPTTDFVRRVLGKFVQVSAIKAATTVEDVDYTDQRKQLNNPELFVGFSNRQVVDKLVREGDYR